MSATALICKLSADQTRAGMVCKPAKEEGETEWKRAWQALLVTCGLAGLYTLVAAWVPWMRSFPVLSWLGESDPWAAAVPCCKHCC